MKENIVKNMMKSNYLKTFKPAPAISSNAALFLYEIIPMISNKLLEYINSFARKLKDDAFEILEEIAKLEKEIAQEKLSKLENKVIELSKIPGFIDLNGLDFYICSLIQKCVELQLIIPDRDAITTHLQVLSFIQQLFPDRSTLKNQIDLDQFISIE